MCQTNNLMLVVGALNSVGLVCLAIVILLILLQLKKG